MLMYSLRQLLECSFLTRRGRVPAAARRGHRPRLEALEDRLAPAVCRFTNANGGAWETPTNWNCGAVPGPNDDVEITNPIVPPGNNMRVTLSAGDREVRQVTGTGDSRLTTSLEISGGATLRINTRLQANNYFTFRLNGGNLSVSPLGSYGFSGSSTFDYVAGEIRLAPQGTMPSIGMTNSTLRLGTGATTGMTFVARGGNALNGSLRSGQTIVVEGTGAQNALLTVAAGTSNAGTIVMTNTHFDPRNAELFIASNGTFTNVPGGLIQANHGSTGGPRSVYGGTLVNQGRIVGSSFLGVYDLYDSAGGTLEGSVAVASGSRVRVSSPPTTGTATIVLHGNTTLLGNNLERTTLEVRGTGGANATLTVATGANNAGTILLTNAHFDPRSANLFIASNGTFTNVPGGLIQANYGSTGGPRAIYGGTQVNQGRIVGSNVLDIYDLYDSAGGILEGSVAMASGSRVRVSSPPTTGATTIVLHGSTTLVGNNLERTTLVVEGTGGQNGVLTVAAGASNAGTIVLTNVHFDPRAADLVITSNGILTNAPGGIIQANYGRSGGPRTIYGQLANAGTLEVFTSLTLGGPELVGEHINTGVVRLSGSLAVRGNSFQNATQGVIHGGGTLFTQAAPFLNRGSINVQSGNQVDISGPFLNFQNRALIGGRYQLAGRLRFDGADVATLDACVTYDGPGAGLLSTANFNALTNLGTITPNGCFAITNYPNFTRTGDLVNNGSISVGLTSQFVVTGAYTQGTDKILTIDRGQFRINGSFTNYAPATGTLTGGTYRIQSTQTVGAALRFPSADIRINAATIVLDGAFPPANPFPIADLATAPQDGLRRFGINRGTFAIEGGRNHTLAIPLDNLGTVSVTTTGIGGDSRLSGTFTNLLNGTLTNGTYLVSSPSASDPPQSAFLRFTNPDSNIRTNAAELVLRGPNARVMNVSGDNALTGLDLNTGQMVFENEQAFTSAANFTNQGTLTVGGNSSFRVTGTLTQPGTVRVLQGGTLSAVRELTNFVAGVLGGSTYHIAGQFRFAGANIHTNAATLILDGPQARITNLIDPNPLDGLRNFAANTGSLTVLDGYQRATPGAFQNSGTVVVRGALSAFGANGDYTQTAGSTTLNDGILGAVGGRVLINSGLLVGSGFLIGDVVNAGTLLVGGAGSTDVLYVVGDYTQTAGGRLTLELAGTAFGTGYDVLFITGQANLGGRLDVLLLSGYFPNFGDCFAGLLFNGRQGSFNDVRLPDLGVELFFDPTLDDTGLYLCVGAR